MQDQEVVKGPLFSHPIGKGTLQIGDHIGDLYQFFPQLGY